MSTRPAKPTIIYDSDCAFCRRQIVRIRRLERPGTFDYLPFKETSPDSWPQLHREGLDAGLRLVEPDGTVHVAADALHAIGRRLPLTRPLAWLLRVPGLHAIAAAGYRWIARNRHRLGPKCSSGACELPSSSDAPPRRTD